LFKGPLLVQRYRGGEALSAPEADTVGDIVNVRRTNAFQHQLVYALPEFKDIGKIPFTRRPHRACFRFY
jgi:hypothetical protein